LGKGIHVAKRAGGKDAEGNLVTRGVYRRGVDITKGGGRGNNGFPHLQSDGNWEPELAEKTSPWYSSCPEDKIKGGVTGICEGSSFGEGGSRLTKIS